MSVTTPGMALSADELSAGKGSAAGVDPPVRKL